MNINNVFNIQNVNSRHTSMAKTLFIFYILVASNYTDNLMAKQMKEYINSNRLVQHIIGLMTMIILVTTVGGIVDTRSSIVYAIVGYLWFIFSTKLDIHWNVVITILLFVGYMYENSIMMQENDIDGDPNLTDVQKMRMTETNNKYKTWIVGSVLLVTVIGTMMYSRKKHVQYGGGYDTFTYLFL